MNIPLSIRFEVEGIRQRFGALFSERNNELNELILGELDKILSEDWIKTEIQAAVRECLQDSINSLANNYKLEQLLEEVMLEQVSKNVTPQSNQTNTLEG